MTATRVEAGGLRPDTVTEWRVDGSALVVEFGAARVIVRALDEGLLRIRASRTGDFRPRRSWAVARLDEDYPQVVAQPVGDGLGVRTPAGAFSVLIAPCGRVDVTTSAGEPLLAGGDGLCWPDDERVEWNTALPRGSFYGFGERTGLLDKRGRRYTCWTTDEWRHQGPDTDELYMAIPFFLVLSPAGRAFGVFLNTTSRTTFDMSDAAGETLTLGAEGGELDAYVISGPEPADVLARFTHLVGRPPLPPRWALGYHQSRWGYRTAGAVRDVARELRRRRIPADAIHVDIDHMDGCRSFTWDRDRFGAPEDLVADLGAAGLKTVCVVSACVKHEPGGYDVYDDGHRRDAFLRDRDGEELQAYLWPGATVYPDHTRADVRAWWGDLYRFYVDAGVAGFVNDMNEPAMHDAPIDEPGSQNCEPPGDLPHGPPDERVTHAEVRNVYATLENQATADALRRMRPGKRPFVLSRSGFAGVQRHAGAWTGDQASFWEHLEMSLPLLLNLGLSGVSFAGTDIGGFFENCDGELLARWTQLGALYPFARNHSARDTAAQEPWAFGAEIEAACRRALELRYRLLPYLYSVFEEATRTGAPVLRPLFFHHAADPRTHRLSDEAFLGRDLLLAPVLRPGVEERALYLPGGVWYDVRTGDRHAGNRWISTPAPLDADVPLFARGGSIVPFGPVVQWTDERPLDPLELAVFLDEGGSADGRLYEDDGISDGYLRGESCETAFAYRSGELASHRAGRYEPPRRSVQVRVYGR